MGKHRQRLAECALAVSHLLSWTTALILSFFLEQYQVKAHPNWKFCFKSFTAGHTKMTPTNKKPRNPNQNQKRQAATLHSHFIFHSYQVVVNISRFCILQGSTVHIFNILILSTMFSRFWTMPKSTETEDLQLRWQKIRLD